VSEEALWCHALRQAGHPFLPGRARRARRYRTPRLPAFLALRHPEVAWRQPACGASAWACAASRVRLGTGSSAASAVLIAGHRERLKCGRAALSRRRCRLLLPQCWQTCHGGTRDPVLQGLGSPGATEGRQLCSRGSSADWVRFGSRGPGLELWVHPSSGQSSPAPASVLECH